MKMTAKRLIGIQIALATVLGGATLHGGCAGALVDNFNPCLTILNCNPAEFDLIGTQPWEPDYSYNPTCTLPALLNCTTSVMTGGTQTGTATGTTTNTNTGLGT
jgi:hypothetical protein